MRSNGLFLARTTKGGTPWGGLVEPTLPPLKRGQGPHGRAIADRAAENYFGAGRWAIADRRPHLVHVGED